MNVLVFFLIALGLALNCFGLAIVNSSLSGKVLPRVPLITAITFALSHLVYSLIGRFVGSLVLPKVQSIELVAAFFIVAAIGVKMIWEARKKIHQTHVFDINDNKVIAALSVATGLNALSIGLVAAILAFPFYSLALLVAIPVFALTYFGLANGQNLGLQFASKASSFGGVLLLLVAVFFLLRFFAVW